ncbi:rab-like protein 3 isoform X1 [Nilaparvata lugens]|uniref:rab-like protein 3 isoform X1 n=1 Tax=Nilaparvata lugens TaxID=108931 RepID=UPI00193DAF33|nr:rab-like protein 3 isoform X1 [Nilaparvata lugens]
MAAIDKVKVLVLGDSGVGKTSLTHLITQNEPISNPSWTVGCTVEVKLHEYKEGTPQQKTYFIELWDVGGSSNHRNSRCVFHNSVHGVILVHDLCNKKSHQNLPKWLAEVYSRDANAKNRYSDGDEFDPEQFAGSSQCGDFMSFGFNLDEFKTPILVIGTKLDVAEQVRSNNSYRSSSFAEDCGADEITLDCRQKSSLAAGTSSSVKISRFFDKVIEMRYYSREVLSPLAVNSASADKRRTFPTTTVSPKFYHND